MTEIAESYAFDLSEQVIILCAKIEAYLTDEPDARALDLLADAFLVIDALIAELEEPARPA